MKRLPESFWAERSHMDDRLNALITVLFLGAILLVFTAADFLNGDRLYSEIENRVLAQKPELDKEGLLDGSYMQDYEKYVTDQFISRDTWVMLQTRGDILLQKKDINGVYLGKDGYLLEQHMDREISRERVESRVALLKDLVERYDADVMLVPTADNILNDKLPANADYYDQTELLSQVRQAVGSRNMIELYDVLKEHSDEELYYRTDHHWTTLGAYYGYQEWRKHTGMLSPYLYSTGDMVTVTDEFLGTLHSRLNLPMEPDSIRYFPQTTRRPVSVTYDFQTTTQSLYEQGYLETKNKYGYFLDDNHAVTEIYSDFHNGRILFVIKDSFANCLIPMLTTHYEKIVVMDLRYYKGPLFDLMDSYDDGSMDVLVLYNCIHFIEDFQYY